MHIVFLSKMLYDKYCQRGVVTRQHTLSGRAPSGRYLGTREARRSPAGILTRLLPRGRSLVFSYPGAERLALIDRKTQEEAQLIAF